jgi:hypothetical protein
MMFFTKDFEKDEVKIKVQGKEYITHLSAELEIDYTPPRPEIRASDNSTIEAPSGADLAVNWAETTLTLHNDQGEEIGTLVYKGVDFFNSLIDINEEDIDFDPEELY